jgi:putative membrane-bound dehydrogenase-like protein
LQPVPAKSPAEALQAFEVADGFHMELVAHEPQVNDPVAACFDENGGMYVAEMIDYPYRPQAGPPLGRVRYLVDADDDGRYERSTIFAESIAWPTGVAPYKGGVFVTAAPDIWYLRDTSGDGVADERRKVYTGFGDRNQQGGINNLVWGIDHKIYGAGSVNGGNVTRVAVPEEPAIELSGRDFRFDPTTEKFETITGREQFGNAFDDWFNRFVCSESNPLVHEVLPQEYLERNPYLAVSAGMNDLSPGVTPIFRISPVERWRQIRSTRRLAAGERGINSAGLSQNVMDAAAGLTIYRGHAYPEKYRGDVFVGCSQNNLVHHRRLIPAGVTFRSERVEPEAEFIRTTDTWFRPVNCINAPDGTLYVLDMSREVIESIHIASDVVKHLDLTNGRDKGRIYRVAPSGFRSPPQPRLGKATSAELVKLLEHPGGWWRDTAARLLFERQDKSVVPALAVQLRESDSAVGRLHVMWTLEGLKSLGTDDLLVALADDSSHVREHAVRLAAGRIAGSEALRTAVLGLAGDDDPRVRFQVAFALGELSDAQATGGLAEVAARDAADSWLRTAVLSSCKERSGDLLAVLVERDGWRDLPQAASWCEELATIAGARHERSEVERIVALASHAEDPHEGVSGAIVRGLGSGLARAGSSLSAVQANLDRESVAYLQRVERDALALIGQGEAPLEERQAAVSLLNHFADEQSTTAVLQLIGGEQAESLQTAALALLRRRDGANIANYLVASWAGSSPKLQEQIITALTSRPAWAGELLAACRDGQIAAAQVSGSQRAVLLGHADETIRKLAESLFASNEERSAAIARYVAEMPREASSERGAQVFEQRCATCHRLGERGAVVGPNLALVRNRTSQALLEAILDPNREVQPGFVNYVALDDAGRTITGILTADSTTSITLTRDKGESETLLKQNLEVLRSTGKSLMPEGLEKDITPAQMADLLSFLSEMQYDIGTRPDFVQPED